MAIGLKGMAFMCKYAIPRMAESGGGSDGQRKTMLIQPGSIYILDRGYLDFARRPEFINVSSIDGMRAEIPYYDAETRKHFVFLKQLCTGPSVAQLYRCRWQGSSNTCVFLRDLSERRHPDRIAISVYVSPFSESPINSSTYQLRIQNPPRGSR